MVFQGERSAKHISVSFLNLPEDTISSVFSAFFPPFTLWYFSRFPSSDSIIYFPVFSSSSSASFPSPMGSHLLCCFSHSLSLMLLMLPLPYMLNDHKRSFTCRKVPLHRLFPLNYPCSLSPFSTACLEKSLVSWLLLDLADDVTSQGIHVGCREEPKNKRLSLHHLGKTTTTKKLFAQCKHNMVSKEGQLDMIKLLANQEVSHN